METQKLGIENLKKLVLLGGELANVTEDVIKAQGMVAKGSALLQLTDEMMGLPGVNFAQIDDEYKDLDEAEKADLLQSFKEKFDLENDGLEAKVEAALALGMKAHGLVVEAIALGKSFKKQPAPEAAPQA